MGVLIPFQLIVIVPFDSLPSPLVGALNWENRSDTSLGSVPFLKSSVEIKFPGVPADGNSGGYDSNSYLTT